MKKTIFIVIISVLLITIVPCSSLSNEISVKTIYVDDDADPLNFRVEFQKLFNRVWKMNGYATNTFDEHITVRWGCPPCTFAFFYTIPDKDLNLLVGQYIPKLYNYNKWYDFYPSEEKLIVSKLFFGISNHFTYGLSKDYMKYFDSWPILPSGDYEVKASLSPYQNENYEMISMGVQEVLIFQYS